MYNRALLVCKPKYLLRVHCLIGVFLFRVRVGSCNISNKSTQQGPQVKIDFQPLNTANPFS